MLADIADGFLCINLDCNMMINRWLNLECLARALLLTTRCPLPAMRRLRLCSWRAEANMSSRIATGGCAEYTLAYCEESVEHIISKAPCS